MLSIQICKPRSRFPNVTVYICSINLYSMYTLYHIIHLFHMPRFSILVVVYILQGSLITLFMSLRVTLPILPIQRSHFYSIQPTFVFLLPYPTFTTTFIDDLRGPKICAVGIGCRDPGFDYRRISFWEGTFLNWFRLGCA